MNWKPSWKIVSLFTLLCLIFFFIALNIVSSLTYQDSDFFTFWLAGRMNWTGQDPYSQTQWLAGHKQFGASWIPNPTFPYPLPLATFLAVLGLLPLFHAYSVWIYFSLVAILFSTLLIISFWEDQTVFAYLLPILAGIFLFRPTIVTLRNGQLGAAILTVLSLALFMWHRGKWLSGGFLIALLILKPTLGIPLISIIGLWLIGQKRGAALIGLLSGCMLLMILGWIREPSWVYRFLSYGTEKLTVNFGYTPTIWGISNITCNNNLRCTMVLGGSLLLLLLLGTSYLLLQHSYPVPLHIALSLGISVTILSTPYLWAYDQIILIIPMITVTMIMAERGYEYLKVAFLPIALALLSLGLLFLAILLGHDVWSVITPFVFLICIVLCMKENLILPFTRAR